MPSTTTMTWNAKQRRWFKKLNNKQYAVSCRELRRLFPDLVTTNTKEGTKKAANKWWEQERLRIETENIPKPWQEKHDPHSYHIDIHQRRKAWYELVEEKSGVAWEQGLIDAIQNARKNKTALSEVLGAEADMQVLRAEEEQWADKYRALDRTADEGRNHRSLEYSVTKLIDQYVEAKRITAMSRQISPGRVENIRIELSRFATWYSGNDARQISGQVLMDFHGHLLTSISDKMVSAYHARDTMATVFRFVKWLWKREVIADLPRVDSSDLRIVVQPGEVHPFADSEVKWGASGFVDSPVAYSQPACCFSNSYGVR